jgi:hypothetical protein
VIRLRHCRRARLVPPRAHAWVSRATRDLDRRLDARSGIGLKRIYANMRSGASDGVSPVPPELSGAPPILPAVSDAADRRVGAALCSGPSRAPAGLGQLG